MNCIANKVLINSLLSVLFVNGEKIVFGMNEKTNVFKKNIVLVKIKVLKRQNMRF